MHAVHSNSNMFSLEKHTIKCVILTHKNACTCHCLCRESETQVKALSTASCLSFSPRKLETQFSLACLAVRRKRRSRSVVIMLVSSITTTLLRMARPYLVEGTSQCCLAPQMLSPLLHAQLTSYMNMLQAVYMIIVYNYYVMHIIIIISIPKL